MSVSSAANEDRPRMIHVSRSFTRMEPTSPVPESPRKRASTMAASGIPTIPEAKHLPISPELAGKRADIFESKDGSDDDHSENETPDLQLPSTFDELPIEIRSMTERFLESLSAKVHPTPLTAEALSELFQDFYARAETQIATHIAILTSRIGREKSPAPSTTSRTSLKGRSRAGSGAKRGDSPSSTTSGGEMLTASEVAHRRRQRKLLELKRNALEEAVERGVCEKVYDRIFKHKSTEDDARDGKLRSRTAALALVGIGLKELHMDTDPAKDDVRRTTEEKEDEIHRSLSSAREALQRMDDVQYPLGKLQQLTTAHKCIVETLAQVFPSSSSADEILPTLIYTLITTPPENINVVSNLNFVQRFRSSSKVDGEAAYCLVNLEAAISFLETVDLSSLRADELPQGPARSISRPSTPTATDKPSLLNANPTENRSLSPAVSTVTTNASELSSSPQSASQALDAQSASPPMSALASSPVQTKQTRPTLHQRRLSSLMQTHADRIEAGRQDLLNTADKAFDSINNTLENSFKFVFGRFKEQVPGSESLPKTLEDAQKLMNPPTTEEEDSLTVSGRSSPGIPSDDPLSTNGGAKGISENKMLELIGGARKQLRDRSVDSSKSTGSGRRVTFHTTGTGAAAVTSSENMQPPRESKTLKEEPLGAAANFITSMNPLNRFAVPGFVPRFGRSPSQHNTPAQPSPASDKARQLGEIVESPATMKPEGRPDFPPLAVAKREANNRNGIGQSENGEDPLNAIETLAELRSIKPPVKRFLDVKDSSELKIGEVQDLLLEYRRLAKAIGDAIAT
ncbi:hypothetical protein K431DRAFT_281383 [Polychaeton citri CBS 116435]|uniref:VPS9 domain-containing protein n=1 Tax=Polychaeton citri CBS 116435 TaxID=1314669 RepID=A0A9P4QCU9_9PEZI|nr:hypothetical protein K431DRAFT_281383 [Polychaeton citri CBS 116435]